MSRTSLTSPVEVPPIDGKQPAAPLVSTAQLKDHLALLRAFADLKKQVLADESLWAIGGTLGDGGSKEWRWKLFLACAVERFELWCNGLTAANEYADLKDILPPVDVVMVWHSYMLNPSWYQDDCLRIPQLQRVANLGAKLASTLGSGLADLLDPGPDDDHPRLKKVASSSKLHGLSAVGNKLFHSSPAARRRKTWKQITGTPFEPLAALAKFQQGSKQFNCPRCSKLQSLAYATYLNEDLCSQCVRCGFFITPNSLALRKLAIDLARPGTVKDEHLLAGTVHIPDPTLKSRRNAKASILETLDVSRPFDMLDRQYTVRLMEEAKYSLEKLVSLCERAPGLDNKTFARIKAAYSHPGFFSVNLVDAAIRHGPFIARVGARRWTDHTRIMTQAMEIVLRNALVRYHRFLDLMSAHPKAHLVPTLDIELVWYTHQLLAKQYSEDTPEYLGYFLDNDDRHRKSERNTIETAQLWEARFHTPYQNPAESRPHSRHTSHTSQTSSDLHDYLHLTPRDAFDDLPMTPPPTPPKDIRQLRESRSHSRLRTEERTEERGRRSLPQQPQSRSHSVHGPRSPMPVSRYPPRPTAPPPLPVFLEPRVLRVGEPVPDIVIDSDSD